MASLRAKIRITTVVIFAVSIAVAGLFGLLKPVPNGCNMTYMYPTYIPIAPPANISTGKYGLYLYHEGWKKIDYDLHLMKLAGVPVLFIPGNGGSYKQVRSLAAESDRAFQGGPLEPSFYQEASFTTEEAGLSSSLNKKDTQEEEWDIHNLFSDIRAPVEYPNCLDWFAVDLEGEHSAMDGRILEEHTEYVVQAIHRILDRYKESFNASSKDSTENIGTLPTSVILVGHSMGGFVARAAIVHPYLRKGIVETVITLSSPHQAPPVALQPSLGHFFSRVNKAWRRGYQVQRTRPGRWISDPMLSNVVVVSVSGGIRDYQIRIQRINLIQQIHLHFQTLKYPKLEHLRPDYLELPRLLGAVKTGISRWNRATHPWFDNWCNRDEGCVAFHGASVNFMVQSISCTALPHNASFNRQKHWSAFFKHTEEACSVCFKAP